MANTNLEITIKALVANAEEMRKVGIKRAQFGDILVELEPFLESEAPLSEESDDAGGRSDPWNDEDTYGEGGGHVPGFQRLRDRGME